MDDTYKPAYSKGMDDEHKALQRRAITHPDEPLQDSVSMGIPLPKGEGFIKETVRIEYEWKLPR
nr:hypothetical protein [Tanacetum cinerariifolium]